MAKKVLQPASSYIESKALDTLTNAEYRVSANNFLGYRRCSDVNRAGRTMRLLLRNQIDTRKLFHVEFPIAFATVLFELQLKAVAVLVV